MSQLIIPTYGTGFARNAEDSEYPELWRGLVGLWSPALGPTGLTLWDWSDHQNHGTLTGMDAATDWVVDEKGYVLDYDGNNNQIDIASSNDFAFGTGDFSWLTWVNGRNFSGNNYLLDFGLNGGLLTYHLGILKYYNSTTGAGSVLYTGALTLNTDTWYHIVATRNSGLTSIYSNGILIKFATDTHNFPAQKLTIGDYGGGGIRWNGQIGDVSIYNRALTSNEIAQMYAGASPLIAKRRSLEIPTSLLLRQSNMYGNMHRLNGGL